MTVEELIKELKKSPKTAEVKVKYSFFKCDCSPGTEYCYCSDTHEEKNLSSVSFDKNKHPYLEI